MARVRQTRAAQVHRLQFVRQQQHLIAPLHLHYVAYVPRMDDLLVLMLRRLLCALADRQ